MEEKWVVTAKRADFNEIGRTFHIDPVIARLIRNRDVVGDEAIRNYLYGTIRDLSDPCLMKDSEKAGRILKQKIAEGASIRVVGDYDIDGVMASYLLRQGLLRLGAKADIAIPHRVLDGYGISERIIREAHEDGIDTIVTCDNGVSAWEPVRLAKDLGMTVVVTDHHEVLSLPDADAAVDPHREDCPYPYKELCGAAVALRLLEVMKCPDTESLLPYAAFATVGDIVDLTGENRILVKEGLKAFEHCRNTGLRMLAAVNGIELRTLDPYQIGFILGPCINAAGRLESADLALELLECEDETEAWNKALYLKELNERRKGMTDEGVAKAVEAIRKNGIENDPVYVVHLPDCHESIAGIIAGRIRESFYHPVFILTGEGETVKGSGRSIDSYPLIDGLKKCAGLLEKYGGHKMAAGLTLKSENVALFRKMINETALITEEDLIPKVRIDVPMPMSYVTEDLIRQLELLKPYGKANPEPLFAMKDVRAENVRILGKEHNVVKMSLRQGGGAAFEAVCFHDAEGLVKRLEQDRTFTAAYYPSVNEYRGIRTLQAVITHYL